MGQGYLWSRPVELSAARELLLRGPATAAPPAPPSAAPPLVRHGDGDDLLVGS
jgi:hypothetical protein